MNGYIQKVESALNEYETLAGKFEELVSDASKDLANIKSLSIVEEKNTELEIQILGNTVKIIFSMVFQNPESPLGQISAILVTNKGTALEEENAILFRWFDYLGNIKGATIEQGSTHNVTQNTYLKTFVYEVANHLLLSEQMAPGINNG